MNETDGRCTSLVRSKKWHGCRQCIGTWFVLLRRRTTRIYRAQLILGVQKLGLASIEYGSTILVIPVITKLEIKVQLVKFLFQKQRFLQKMEAWTEW